VLACFFGTGVPGANVAFASVVTLSVSLFTVGSVVT
jgi:hypothetical protein